jgi:hypothetical protein
MSHAVQSQTDLNYEAFQTVLPSLPPELAGKYALMHDQQIVEYFDSSLAATLEGLQKFGAGEYSVQEVAPEPENLGFYSYVGGAGQC